MICPYDFTPCVDDICRGSGCVFMQGMPMLEQCHGCGALVSDEDKDDCTCPPQEYDDES